MMELLPISFTFASLVKIALIVALNMLVGYAWYSPIGFQKQWLKAMQWKEGDECHKAAATMSTVGTLLNAFLLNILLTGFDIRHQQFLSAMLAAAVLCGFHAFIAWNDVFFARKSEQQQRRTLYLIDIGYTFVLYILVSFVLVGF